MLAFFSLAQQVRVSATGLDIGRLEVERQRLEDTAADVRSDLEPARPRAGDPQAGPRRRARPAVRAARPPGTLGDRPSDAGAYGFAQPPPGAAVVFILGSLALTARLAYWQVVDRERLASEALAQTTLTLETPSKRGDVFDRTGTIVLATTVQRERLVAAPDQLTPENRRATVAELTRILGLDDAESIALRDRLTGDAKYVIVRTASNAPRPTRSVLRWTRRRRSACRSSRSPSGSTRSRVAARARRSPRTCSGSSTARAPASTASSSPTSPPSPASRGSLVTQRDANGQPILDEATVTEAGTPGTDLRLTIDAGLQLRVEQELLAAWVADRAKRASAVVMDPYTGEIYAMATYPSYDANDYKAIAASEPGRFVDPMVSTVYEPGSVFKMKTAAAALEAGTVTRQTRIKDVGTLRLDNGKTKIDDADRKGMGWLSFEDGIAYSRNVVAAKVALGLGKTTRESSATLYDMWTRLGYGQPTGIDLAGEVGGLVRDPGLTPWREIDLANGAFGQGVAVTPIQLATAYAALMNGGSLVKPHVVKAIGDQDVAVDAAEPGHRLEAIRHARRDDAARHHGSAVLPRPDARPRLRRRRQDGHRADLGSERQRGVGAPGRSTCSTTRSSASSAGRRDPGSRRRDQDRGGKADGRQGRPAGDAGHVVRALPPHRHRCDHDAGPAAPTRPIVADPDQRPVSGRLCDTGDRDRRRSVDPGAGARDRHPPSRADDLVRLTGGRLLARSDRPIRGAAVDSRLVDRRRAVRGPAGRAHRRPRLPGRCRRRGRRRCSSPGPSPEPDSLGDVTVVRVADPLAALGAIAAGWRARFDPLVVGVTGSIAKTSTKEAIATVLGGGSGRSATRATRTTRSACR